MRKPPDKPGLSAVPSMSEREVDTSNATLHTLLGGSHQRPWMTGGMAPVRPTPRRTSTNLHTPSTLLPPLPPTVNSTQKNLTSVLPSPTSSDGPSPDLAQFTLNGVQKENQRPTPSNSEDATPYDTNKSPLQPPHVRPTASRPQPRIWTAFDSRAMADRGMSRERVTEVEDDELEYANQNRSRASGAYNGRHSAIEERNFNPELLQSPSPEAFDLSPAQLEISEDASSRFPSSNALTQQISPIVQAYGASPPPLLREELQSQNQSRGSTLASTGVMTDFSPTGIQAPVENRRQAPSALPQIRRQSQPQAAPSLKSMVAVIDNYLASNGGERSLNIGLERPRFQLLRDACSKNDGFYVAMHQLFCVWDVDQTQVMSIPDFPPEETLVIAFKIVGQLIRHNSQLLPIHRSWFSEFPGPLVHFLRNSEPYRRITQSVGLFLARLAVDWLAFAQDVQSRNYPPLVDELVSRLGILSPILQRIVFTATRRNLGVQDDETGNSMEDMFQQDQKESQYLSARVNTGQHPTQQEILERNRRLVEYYSRLLGNLPQLPSSTRAPMSGSLPQPNVSSAGPSIQRPQLSSFLASNASAPVGHGTAENGQSPTDGQSWRGVARAPTHTDLLYHPSAQAQQILTQLQHVQRELQRIARDRQAGRLPRADPIFSENLHNYERSLLHQQAVCQQSLSNLQPMANPLRPQQLQGSHNSQYQQHPPNTQHGPNRTIIQNQPNNVASNFRIVPSTPNAHPIHQMPTPSGQNPTPSSLNQGMGGGATRMSPVHQGSGFTRPQGYTSLANNGPFQPQGSTPVAPPVFQDLVKEYIQTPILERSVIPPSGFFHQPHGPRPEMTSLHQAHLRSPKLLPLRKFPANLPLDHANRRFYQVVKGFAHPPSLISPTRAVSKFEFSISSSEFASIAQHKTDNAKGQTEVREFVNGTLQYRMRCVRKKTPDHEPDWVVEDTAWPENAVFQLTVGIQKQQVELRRKAQHGKDLPVDLTAYIRFFPANSQIQITVSVPGQRKRSLEAGYFFAVEIIEILGHEQIMEACQKQRKPIQETSGSISRSLICADVEDDDISLVSSEMIVDVTDPFSSRVFDIPVRGKSCLHPECFDLETFLLSRNSKPNSQGQPSMIDVWKCPLCNKDARPSKLHVDEYFLNVRTRLEERGALDTKAIVINKDGQWKPKALPQANNRKRQASPNNDSDDDDDDDYSIQLPKKRRTDSASIVIELLDD